MTLPNRKTRLIIAGSRSIDDYDYLCGVLMQFTAGGRRRGVYEIVSGGADGVDQQGERWAEEYDCTVKRFNPDLEDYGKAAGPIRNQTMANYGDILVAIWDGKSTGTRSMIDEAITAGCEVHVY